MRCTISKKNYRHKPSFPRKASKGRAVKAIFEDNLDKLPTFAQNE